LISITDSNFILPVNGDITLKIYNNTMLSTKKIGRVSFNTAFLQLEQTSLKFNLKEIDPDNLSRNKNIAKDFEIHIKFGSLCDCQNRELPIKLCSFCAQLLKNELKDWEEINEIIKVNIYLF
jgi:hypothetical protein